MAQRRARFLVQPPGGGAARDAGSVVIEKLARSTAEQLELQARAHSTTDILSTAALIPGCLTCLFAAFFCRRAGVGG